MLNSKYLPPEPIPSTGFLCSPGLEHDLLINSNLGKGGC